MRPSLTSFGDAVRRLNPELCGLTPSGQITSLKPVPAGAEDQLHADILDWCAKRGWLAFHGAMSARTHRTAGEPDFIILAPEGRFYLIEAKTRTGKLSPAQRAIKAWAAKLGHNVAIVRSLADFEQAVQKSPE